jgi:hypothetical protein
LQDKKPLLNVKVEQSKMLEKVEELRQLVLTSTLRQDRILRLDSQVDNVMLNIHNYYTDLISAAQQEVGNV